jgi:hypothetical protein
MNATDKIIYLNSLNSCDSGSKGVEEGNEYIFASVDGRAERIVARVQCIWQSSEMLIQLM